LAAPVGNIYPLHFSIVPVMDSRFPPLQQVGPLITSSSPYKCVPFFVKFKKKCFFWGVCFHTLSSYFCISGMLFYYSELLAKINVNGRKKTAIRQF
jgi:hypothetical protein